MGPMGKDPNPWFTIAYVARHAMCGPIRFNLPFSSAQVNTHATNSSPSHSFAYKIHTSQHCDLNNGLRSPVHYLSHGHLVILTQTNLVYLMFFTSRGTNESIHTKNAPVGTATDGVKTSLGSGRLVLYLIDT